MLEALNKFIHDNRLVNKNDRIILAVSGGIDSMVMAHLFLSTGIETAIAHCNFCLRAEESDKDEELVRNFASAHNKEFFSIRFNTREYAKLSGISIQMAARELRYNWFEEVRKKHRYNSIAVAHNLNDNTETLLINLVRGSGLSGLTGIKPVTNNIIRPLLFATRQSITLYCKEHNIEYREDRSNAETKYTRNKIRHLVIPILKEINPSVETTLNETTERLTGISEIVNTFIVTLREEITTHDRASIIVDIPLLKKYFNNNTILFELFKPYNITNHQINDLKNIIVGRTGKQIYTDSHRIIKNRANLIISENSEYDNSVKIISKVAELKSIPVIISARKVVVNNKFIISRDKNDVSLDYDKITFPLIVRKWKAGDYFFPFGMNTKKKLSDYFIDKKFSIRDKEEALVIESEGNIIWIIGERTDNRFRITQSTTMALVIKTKN